MTAAILEGEIWFLGPWEVVIIFDPKAGPNGLHPQGLWTTGGFTPLSFHAWRINGNHNLPRSWDALEDADLCGFLDGWDLLRCEPPPKKTISTAKILLFNLFQLDAFSSKAITMEKTLMKTARHLEDRSSLNSSTSWQCPRKANKQLPYPDAQRMAYLPTKLGSFRGFHPR